MINEYFSTSTLISNHIILCSNIISCSVLNYNIRIEINHGIRLLVTNSSFNKNDGKEDNLSLNSINWSLNVHGLLVFIFK